ncbi:MAG: multidrug efflux SMR transporter [Betaproteobacteria bacterium]|nr:multidrug efflux SMR transporter [Betaproteobacteria bacterium]
MHTAWYFLGGAIFFEVAGTTCMKLSKGFTEITPSILMFVLYACAFGLNTVATKTIELSVAYAIWSGVGTALTAAIGIFYFKEPATTLKMVSLGLIVIGVMGLHSASVAK